MEHSPSNCHLRCVSCQKQQPNPLVYSCSSCGGELDVVYDYEKIRDKWKKQIPARVGPEFGLGRFSDLLPAVLAPDLSLGEGGTPLLKSRHFSQKLGLPNLYFKCEHLNPTGSFKDREISVAVAVALKFGRTGAIISSSGNAGAALATFAARSRLKVLVFVPIQTPEAKVAQIKRHGAKVWMIEQASSSADHYLARAKAVQHIAEQFGWAPVVTARSINPFTTEGVKTIAYEIIEQTPTIPDWVVLPVGGGGLLGGVHKGFQELSLLEVIGQPPRLLGVQAEGCSTVSRAFLTNQEIRPVRPNTKITGVGAPMPYDADWALDSIRQSRGAASEVTDDAVFSTTRDLARFEGIFVEPAGAVSVTALADALQRGVIKESDTVVCCLTGSGFKDMEVLLNEKDAEAPIKIHAGQLSDIPFLKTKLAESFK